MLPAMLLAMLTMGSPTTIGIDVSWSLPQSPKVASIADLPSPTRKRGHGSPPVHFRRRGLRFPVDWQTLSNSGSSVAAGLHEDNQ